MAYVYIVECKDGTLYTGYAVDLKKRMAEHNRGAGAKYTRARLPVLLRYAEVCTDKSAAMRREHAIKKLTRDQKQELIKTVCVLSQE